MKAYKKPAGYRLAILSILLLIIGSGCSLTRGIGKNQTLVRKITIKGIDEQFEEAALNYVDKEQQPNNKLNLQFYYWFSNHGKRNIGEAPTLLDSSLVEYSRFQMEKFVQNRGYLKAKVTDSVIIKKQRAEIVFTAVEGPMFHIRKLVDSIPDKNIANLYHANRNRMSHIQPGGRFDTDSLAHDRDELYLLMKRNGYFDFYRQYVNFTYDSTFNSSVVDIKMMIDNPAGKTEHPVYKINNTLITISASNGKTTGKADTLQVDSQFRYVDFSHRFKPRVVIDYTFQKKGQLYNIDKQTLTTTRLSELNVFRNVPNPTYEKLADSTHRLDTKIDIIPLKHYSDRVEGEFLFANGRYGYNVGNTFTNRNLFNQAAILQLKLNWSILFDNGSNTTNNDNIQNQEFRAGANLIYPRIISPFNFPLLGKFGVPHTTFSTNYSLFYQKGLVTRQSFINSISYDFYETARKLHTITPVNIEFSKGVIDPAAYDSLLSYNRFAYIKLIGRTVFTTGSQYTFQYNAIELNSYDNFLYFRGSLDIGGNFLNLLSSTFNTGRDTSGQRKFLGYTFSQYAKAEGDLRFYRTLGGEKQFVFRVNPGIGVPYGNSDQLIFEKNFYAGGANDMRAWLPRTLGPGQFNRATAYYNSLTKKDDPISRARLKYLDQFGEIKLVANAEYRYKLINNFFGAKLKGAVFVDAGNVWRLGKKAESPNGEFRFDNLLQSTAIGIGTGLRFDLSFFVFRLDMAFKFKDPQFSGSDQWVLIKHADELFKSGSFKEAYLKANATGVDSKGNVVGDSYNFMQLNFGIGLPF
ncbi:BamA/TamA family outer membrane protein [Mucilaginibacter sp. KACC 22773]|uniref:translocation and assembly module lipoprotein TamL n=1 Tax=Mucilaginibacter sp. KACC 22773 TaxID=3025671 RepID=UPI002366DDA1|nr:BamA/TamA family outer membrane protein [Mucilaginibacter sp. KACC 22773]WDF76643.1 BamA/TamA family outer membrane protein [Mucilaginibacter sp. KACC 22773]